MSSEEIYVKISFKVTDIFFIFIFIFWFFFLIDVAWDIDLAIISIGMVVEWTGLNDFTWELCVKIKEES